MREEFKKFQCVILLFYLIALSSPFKASADNPFLTRVLKEVRSLLAFSDMGFDPGRRNFLRIAGAVGAVMVADPSHLMQVATGMTNTSGMAAHEIYSLNKLRSLVPLDTLARLQWSLNYGMPAGSFNAVDLARLGRFAAGAE